MLMSSHGYNIYMYTIINKSFGEVGDGYVATIIGRKRVLITNLKNVHMCKFNKISVIQLNTVSFFRFFLPYIYRDRQSPCRIRHRPNSIHKHTAKKSNVYVFPVVTQFVNVSE